MSGPGCTNSSLSMLSLYTLKWCLRDETMLLYWLRIFENVGSDLNDYYLWLENNFKALFLFWLFCFIFNHLIKNNFIYYTVNLTCTL